MYAVHVCAHAHTHREQPKKVGGTEFREASLRLRWELIEISPWKYTGFSASQWEELQRNLPRKSWSRSREPEAKPIGRGPSSPGVDGSRWIRTTVWLGLLKQWGTLWLKLLGSVWSPLSCLGAYVGVGGQVVAPHHHLNVRCLSFFFLSLSLF